MSHSPLEAVDATASEDYRKAWTALMALVDQGSSFSGHERHCAFLNTGGGTFANVSAVSGFDLPDDGRSIGLVDWDHDGDLDLWIANRTAPRLRFLRNDLEAVGHAAGFISLHLEGTKSNRDAIGARVEIETEGEDSREPAATQRRTVYGGHGFLSQSSKWLHFGLGRAGRVERLRIRWPSGQVDELRDLAANRRYRVIEGEGRATIDGAPGTRPVEGSLSLEAPSDTAQTRIVLALRSPLPALRGEPLDGDTGPVLWTPGQGGACLLNLWASWCAPCRGELAEFAEKREDLTRAGLRVIALSVDSVTRGGDRDAARRLVAKMDWPFESGFVTAELLDQIELLYAQILQDQRPLPVPTSFLVDRDGWLTSIYRGRVKAAQVIEDVALTRLSPSAYLERALPFGGRWHELPFRPDIAAGSPGWTATAFEVGGHATAALDIWRGYLEYDKKVAWPTDPRVAAAWNQDLARVLMEYVGRLHFKANRGDIAEATLRRARELAPGSFEAPAGER